MICRLIMTIHHTNHLKQHLMAVSKADQKTSFFMRHRIEDIYYRATMIENERSTAINPSESVEEKVSLSDRFGLWLGFHKCSQAEYLQMIDGYIAYHDLEIEPDELRRQALEWATTRGSRSGRVAWQYITDLAGRLGQPLKTN
ncbi:hypothetical protein GQR58_018034 [Nymphon striatum]|nr:hypothetical protein GQR58_018034 [Nymphon striatum]